MEDSNESKKTGKEIENLSLQTNGFSRDLLQRFMGTELEMGKEDSEEIELNLGLLLGGKFGVDKSKLIRSSSIAGSIPIIRDDDAVAQSRPVAYPSLVRTSSLPVETEEEWRKRKELQTLRRMAAKRRRSEKQRNLKGDRDGNVGGSGGGGEGFEDEKKETDKSLRGKVDREQLLAMKRFGSTSVVPPVGFFSRAGGGAAKQGASSGSTGQLSSQGSMESQRGSSSRLLELETKAFLGRPSSTNLSAQAVCLPSTVKSKALFLTQSLERTNCWYTVEQLQSTQPTIDKLLMHSQTAPINIASNSSSLIRRERVEQAPTICQSRTYNCP